MIFQAFCMRVYKNLCFFTTEYPLSVDWPFSMDFQIGWEIFQIYYQLLLLYENQLHRVIHFIYILSRDHQRIQLLVLVRNYYYNEETNLGDAFLIYELKVSIILHYSVEDFADTHNVWELNFSVAIFYNSIISWEVKNHSNYHLIPVRLLQYHISCDFSCLYLWILWILSISSLWY